MERKLLGWNACICFGVRFKLLSLLHANTEAGRRQMRFSTAVGLVFLVSSEHRDGHVS